MWFLPMSSVPIVKAILPNIPPTVLQNQSLPEPGNKPHHGMFINILTLEGEELTRNVETQGGCC